MFPPPSRAHHGSNHDPLSCNFQLLFFASPPFLNPSPASRRCHPFLMVDFALQAEREEFLNSHDAICKASLVRFRPIMMTTFAAILGALPLVIADGYGSELRRPLGVSIIGGLVISQILTLYTTPVICLYLD